MKKKKKRGKGRIIVILMTIQRTVKNSLLLSHKPNQALLFSATVRFPDPYPNICFMVILLVI